MTKHGETAKKEAIERLREFIKPGDTIYCQLKHVSRSGMSRVIQLLKLEDNEPRWIGYNVAEAIGMPYDRKREGIRIGGCGMDMGFALVYDLGYVLFGKGYQCIGENCPSNAHTNRETPPAGTCLDHAERREGVCKNKNCKPWVHTDGYALRHRWL